MGNRSTLRHIAEMTGYSVNTVSKALNNKYGVNEKTRAAILQAADLARYKPNFFARGIRGQNSNLLGLVVGDITNMYFINILKGVEAVANSEGMAIIICNSNEDLEKEEKAVDILSSYNCNGILICPVASNQTIIDKLIAERANFVALDTQFGGSVECDQVSVKIKSDFHRATEYLLACGHRRIGFITSAIPFKTVTSRRDGYEQALSANGVSPDPALIKLCQKDLDAKGACDALLGLADRPTAILVAREAYGLNAMASIMNHGLRLCDDMSLLVYGDPEWASTFNPGITCMQRPIAEMARLGTRLLIEKCRSSAESPACRSINLDSQLIVRESVKLLTGN